MDMYARKNKTCFAISQISKILLTSYLISKTESFLNLEDAKSKNDFIFGI